MIVIIKSEVDFGLDDFGSQKILSPKESVAQLLFNLLFMRPGQMPSMPNIGINIKKYLYQFEEDLDVNSLRAEISQQCSEIMPYLNTSNMALTVQEYQGHPLLLLVLPITIDDESSTLIAGFQNVNTKTDTVKFSYTFDKSLLD